MHNSKMCFIKYYYYKHVSVTIAIIIRVQDNSFCLLSINEHHTSHIHALMVKFKFCSIEHMNSTQICYIIYYKRFSRYCDHHQGTCRYS
jgi:hypothetical protein